MNKLYAFCALVFLSACGSSGIDGSWSSVEDANIGIEIKGDEARLTAEGFSEICPVEGPDQDVYTLACDDAMSFIYLKLLSNFLLVGVSYEKKTMPHLFKSLKLFV